MPIDTSMYSQMQSPDILGGIEKGMRLGDLIQNRKLKDQELAEKQKIKDAYKQGVVTNPDGTTSIDDAKTLSALAGISPMEAKEYQRKMLQDRATQFDMHTKENELIARIAPNIKDQPTYEEGLKYLSAQGVDVSKMPQQYDPGLVSNHARSSQAWLDQNWREIEAKRDQGNKDRTHRLQERELGLKRDELNTKRTKESGSGENLPLDQKKMVEGLSTKNASKIAIRNQILGVMSNWDNLTDDQKVMQGGQLIKTLNSTEGADAVGAEESKRLGAKLQFAMGNLTNSNPIQFGRDLEGFKTQAMDTANSIGRAVNANQAEIDRLMGRSTSVAGGASGDWGSSTASTPQPLVPPKHGTVEDGYVFMGGDPKNPKSWKLASKTASKVRTEKE